MLILSLFFFFQMLITVLEMELWIKHQQPRISSCLSQIEKVGKRHQLFLEAKKIDPEQPLKNLPIPSAPNWEVRGLDANLLDPHLCNADNTPASPSRRAEQVTTSLFASTHSKQNRV